MDKLVFSGLSEEFVEEDRTGRPNTISHEEVRENSRRNLVALNECKPVFDS
jgi:hypothetical protein